MEIRIIHTNGRDPNFKKLTNQLDHHLERLNGKDLQNERYAKFNTTDHIEDAFIIEVDHQYAGCGAFKPYNENTAELKRIFVLEKYRRLGLASQLIQYIEQCALLQGYTTMVLESATKLKEAHLLYQKLGYQKIDNFPPFVGMDTSYCFKKEL